jgi:hypothetical protein
MELFKLSVNDEIYGRGLTEIAISNAKRTGKKIDFSYDTHHQDFEDGFIFWDERIFDEENKLVYDIDKNSEKLNDIFFLLSINHDAIAEENMVDGEKKITVNTSSPDEGNYYLKKKGH